MAKITYFLMDKINTTTEDQPEETNLLIDSFEAYEALADNKAEQQAEAIDSAVEKTELLESVGLFGNERASVENYTLRLSGSVLAIKARKHGEVIRFESVTTFKRITKEQADKFDKAGKTVIELGRNDSAEYYYRVDGFSKIGVTPTNVVPMKTEESVLKTYVHAKAELSEAESIRAIAETHTVKYAQQAQLANLLHGAVLSGKATRGLWVSILLGHNESTSLYKQG